MWAETLETKKPLKCIFNALEEWMKLDTSSKFHGKLNVD